MPPGRGGASLLTSAVSGPDSRLHSILMVLCPLQPSASTSGIRVPPGSGLPGLRGRGRGGDICVLHPGKPLECLGLPRDTVK